MPDPGVEFERIATPETPGTTGKLEENQLAAQDGPPNSVTLNFGRLLQIRWHAESGAPLFCFMSILLLLVFGALVALFAAFATNPAWAGDVFKFLGQAILTLVGAVVGASASSASSSRGRRSGSGKG